MPIRKTSARRARIFGPFPLKVVAMLLLLLVGSPSPAQITLSDLVIELAPGQSNRRDIELLNEGDNRAYVLTEPFEIIAPGTASEQRIPATDPEQAGLLVSPARMIVEARQRKLIRLSAIDPSPTRERVYRLTVRPVPGELLPDQQGLQVTVGYDVLVLVRSPAALARLTGRWQGDRLTITNEGSASAELSDGRGCIAATRACRPLVGKRLYAGASWTVDAGQADRLSFIVKTAGAPTHQLFERHP